MDAETFLAELRAHREKKGLSRRELAAAIGTSNLAIKRLEAGQGSVGLLTRVMESVEFHLAGVARGWSLYEQLLATRLRKKRSIADISRHTSLSRQAIVDVEAGRGSVRSILRLLEYVGPAARTRQPMPRQSWAYDPKARGRDVRFTPPDLLRAVRVAFGDIDLDPCGHAASYVNARLTIDWSKGGDGLTDEWSGSLCFMNPPFSAMLKWLRRAEDQWQRGNVDKVLALVPARLDSPWVHDHLADIADVWIIRGRMRFWSEQGQDNFAPFPVMAVFMGLSMEEISRFTSMVPGSWFAPRTRVKACSELACTAGNQHAP